MRTTIQLLSILLAVHSVSSATVHCPIQGPEFPTPQKLTQSSFVKTAKDTFVTQLNGSAVYTNTTAFSVSVFSLDETEPLFEYHNSPSWVATSKEGVKKVDSDTVYRIGSVSKLYTVWLLLIEAGEASFSDPVTKYIPELADAAKNDADIDEIAKMRWDEMTLGDLASQLSGIIREPTLGDLSTTPIPWTSIGLPPLNASSIPKCNVNETTPSCSRKEFFDSLLHADPVYPVSQTPIYSNTNFELLGYALESITGKPFSDALTTTIINKLGLTHTSTAPPKDSSIGVIPIDKVTSWWSVDWEQIVPTGGLFTSTNDLIAAGRAMLSSTLLTPAQTRRWMKPHARTSSPIQMIGAPWEIFYVPIGSNQGIEVYGKTGSLGLYNSIFGLVPDLGIGFTVLSARTEEGGDASIPLFISVVQNFLPAIIGEAKTQAAQNFAGIFGSEKTNQTVTISVDDAPGLGATSKLFENVIEATLGKGSVNATQRLYPTGLKSYKEKADGNGKYVSRMAFRSVFDPLGEEGGQTGFELPCFAWAGVSGSMYGGVSFDEFVFEMGEDGKATGVEVKALREKWVRKG